MHIVPKSLNQLHGMSHRTDVPTCKVQAEHLLLEFEVFAPLKQRPQSCPTVCQSYVGSTSQSFHLHRMQLQCLLMSCRAHVPTDKLIYNMQLYVYGEDNIAFTTKVG